MLLLTVAACAACCAALWAAFVVFAAGLAERTRRDERASAPARPREEDRVRPAVDASGARIWVDQEDVFWHEIVCWPARRPAADAELLARSRPGA